LDTDEARKEIDLVRNSVDGAFFSADLLWKDIFSLAKEGAQSDSFRRASPRQKIWGTRLQPDAPPRIRTGSGTV